MLIDAQSDSTLLLLGLVAAAILQSQHVRDVRLDPAQAAQVPHHGRLARVPQHPGAGEYHTTAGSLECRNILEQVSTVPRPARSSAAASSSR